VKGEKKSKGENIKAKKDVLQKNRVQCRLCLTFEQKGYAGMSLDSETGWTAQNRLYEGHLPWPLCQRGYSRVSDHDGASEITIRSEKEKEEERNRADNAPLVDLFEQLEQMKPEAGNNRKREFRIGACT
jgi:hypothetical protein